MVGRVAQGIVLVGTLLSACAPLAGTAAGRPGPHHHSASATAGAKPEGRGGESAAWTAAVAPQWLGTSIPTGQGTAGDGGWLISVSCAEPEKCVALGGLAHDGADFPLVARLTGGPWQRVRLPGGPGLPWPQGYVPFAVRCPAMGDCSAVGTYTTAHGAHLGLAYTETDGLWHVASLAGHGLVPRPGRDPHILFDALSCPSPGYCVALASYQDASSRLHHFVYEMRGGRWEPEQVTLAHLSRPAVPGSDGDLESVSCWATGHCVIVGSYSPASGSSLPLVVSGGDGRWTAGTPPTSGLKPAPGPASSAELSAVECLAGGECIAVGTYEDNGNEVLGDAVESDNKGWSAVTLPLDNLVPGPAGTVTTVPTALSCASQHFCVTVGTYRDLYGDVQAFADTFSGGKWAAWELPTYSFEPTVKPRAVFGVTSVACPRPGQCTATGFYGGLSNETHGFIEQLSNGLWSGQAQPLVGLVPAAGGFPGSRLDALDCPGPESCAAVGYYSTSAGLVRPLAEVYGP